MDVQGHKRTLKVKISANYQARLPYVSTLTTTAPSLKICDDIVDREGRFKMSIAVPTFTLLRYAGKSQSAREQREVRLWFKRMTATLIEGAIYRAKKERFDEGFTGTLFSQVVVKGEQLRNGKIADTNYVWLSPWFLSNYYHRYTRPIDFEFYKRLRKPIAKSLYTLLRMAGTPRWQALCEELPCFV